MHLYFIFLHCISFCFIYLLFQNQNVFFLQSLQKDMICFSLYIQCGLCILSWGVSAFFLPHGILAFVSVLISLLDPSSSKYGSIATLFPLLFIKSRICWTISSIATVNETNIYIRLEICISFFGKVSSFFIEKTKIVGAVFLRSSCWFQVLFPY